MSKRVVAVYNDFDTARQVVEALVNAGFDRDDISLVANDSNTEYRQYLEDNGHDDVKPGEGAGFGAVVGTLVGLGVALIPGIGPVIAAGPLAAALMAGIGAAAGAATGGIVASLIDFGIPEEEANIYAENIRRGGTLVAVEVDDNRVGEAQNVMNRYSPVDIEESGNTFRSSGWNEFDEMANDVSAARVRPMIAESPVDEQVMLREEHGTVQRQPLDRSTTSADLSFAEEAVATGYRPYADYETGFRTHFNTNYASSGYTYDQYSPAYRYGYTLATNERFNRYSDWTQMEPEARRYWEERNPNTWERFKDTIRDAWYEVTGRK